MPERAAERFGAAAAADRVIVAHRDPLRLALAAVIACALVAVAVAGGFFWGDRSGRAGAAAPAASSVDAGFARDMSDHHQQAITMATYVEHNTDDANLATLAYDIESSQTEQLGEMSGWLDAWGLPREFGTRMGWMPTSMGGMTGTGSMDMSAQSSSSALSMPGMASAAQLTTLTSAHGRALNVLFLQLMIHHHQGGLAMERYAAEHATQAYVRTFAGHLVAGQLADITAMKAMLKAMGGSPLPAPAQ